MFRECPVDATMAVQNGYTESKWISEEILTKAAESTPAKPLIIRVGQLSGGINGAWNISEWVPALVQSAQFIRCIPDDGRVRAIRAS
jgi:thioester reductase-like protein